MIPTTLTLQDMIAKILGFWSQHGCIIHQGHDLEVGAGTFNPATFLQALGPEPYKTAYVEPSRRPQDGRYGTHPNRLQKYHQLQVLLKPVPDNFIDLYKQSLQTIGLNLHEHDLRLVHDDWENPTIGAWGLGWEVWLNGMEVTQLTYFQAVGSKPLDIISGEITYGIERIAMYLQKKDSVFDILWNDTLTYGDVTQAAEQAWSQYNFEAASTEMWWQHFEHFVQEALKVSSLNLPLPAYDFVIKASHAFNILDARGVISVSERTRYIARIRQLARTVADKYVEWRSSLNFPLLNKHEKSKQLLSPKPTPVIDTVEDILIEIGSEELPATFVPIGIQQLESSITKMLRENKISYEAIEVFGSPRRLSVIIYQVPPQIIQSLTEKKGPILSSIFNEQGEVTLQGKQFFAAKGLLVNKIDDLPSSQYTIKPVGTHDYLFIQSTATCVQTADILVQSISKLIQEIKFPKQMTWDLSGVEYARPIRWLVALYGNEVLPITIGHITADRITKGHQQLDAQNVILSSPRVYRDTLRAHGVIVSQEERKQMIQRELATHPQNCEPILIPHLLEESVFLTEHPFVAYGQFDKQFCVLPKELLIAEMVNHQKYFPTQDSFGKITDRFAMVCDNHPNETIIHGNNKAITPRLTDGHFLFNQDLNTPLSTFVEKLKTVTYLEPLGSLFDKKERLKQHAQTFVALYPMCNEDELLLAIEYCKADLVSSVVNEFTNLQGVMGQYYLENAGIFENVAQAVGQHLQHITKNSKLSTLGAILSLLDRLDNLLSCFILNLRPTASHDPYALRRQSLEILFLLHAFEIPLDFKYFLNHLCNHFPTHISGNGWDRDQIIQDLTSFVYGRLKTFLLNLGCGKDTLSAVLSDHNNDLFLSIIQNAEAIEDLKNNHQQTLETIIRTHNRLKKILHSLSQIDVSSSYFLQADIFENNDQLLAQALLENVHHKSASETFLQLSILSKKVENFLDTTHIMSSQEDEQRLRVSFLKAALEAFGNVQWEFMSI